MNIAEVLLIIGCWIFGISVLIFSYRNLQELKSAFGEILFSIEEENKYKKSIRTTLFLFIHKKIIVKLLDYFS